MIEVNTNKREEEINQLATESVNAISENAKNGRAITELSFDKEIGGDVRREIEKRLDADGTQYDWLTMYKSPNPYTGVNQYFTGQTIGNTKYYKLKIY